MKYPLALLVLIGLILPSVALGAGLVASSAGTVYSVASVEVSSGGSVNSSTKSSASTGGNSVGEEGSVQTGSASASASSKVETGEGGGTVEISVESETNGVSQKETYKKDLKAGESVDIRIATSSEGRANKIDGYTKSSINEEASTTASSDASVVTVTDENISRSQSFAKISLKNFFSGISSVFRGFVNLFFSW